MIHLYENINMGGCTLTFPSVSVGNIGQLATDLLVTKLKPKKVGIIWHSAIMPFVGGDPYNFSESSVTTSAEVFFSEQCKLIIIQIRSPIMQLMHGLGCAVDEMNLARDGRSTCCIALHGKSPNTTCVRFLGHASTEMEQPLIHNGVVYKWQETSDEFICELVNWIKENNVIKVVILTGVFDYTSLGSEIGVGALKIVVPATLSDECDQFERIANGHTSSLNHVSVLKLNSSDKFKIHGGGIARRLLKKCFSKGVSAVIVMKYCSEGDNVPDAKLLCILLNHMLQLVDFDCAWDSPPSWSYLYGNSLPAGLY